MEGNAFLVGEVDSENRPEGDSLYLYPDLCTAILGQYQHGKLRTGGLVRLRDCREEAGSLIAQTEAAEDDSVIEYDQSGRVFISRTPHHRQTYHSDSSHNDHLPPSGISMK